MPEGSDESMLLLDEKLAELRDIFELLAGYDRLSRKAKRMVRDLKEQGYTARQLAHAAKRTEARIFQILAEQGSPPVREPHDHNSTSTST